MKFRLMTPGPTPVPEETLLELAKPMVYHRTAEFREVLGEVIADMRTVYMTESNVVLPLTASGTGALEASLVNSVPAGKKAICCVAGKFGERWTNIAKAYGIEPIVINVPWGQAVQPEQIEKALKDHPDTVAVCTTLSETSTGIGHDIQAFGKIVAGTPAILLVDAVSGLGAMEFRQDAWQVDICATGSQKALMMPPGLAFVSVSPKAWKTIEANPNPRTFYFDLKKARKSIEGNDTPYTPAHTLIKAMRLSLKRIVGEGMENIFTRQDKYARAARSGFQALGLEIFPTQPNTALTVVKSPNGVDSTQVLSKLEKKYGLKLANGQDALKGKILRMTHMGYIDQFDILAGIAGTELTLAEMGVKVEVGAGVAAAQRVFAGK
jgi:aspartate aminotransferase-like enzyme